MSNYIKFSDFVAGTIATLIALLYITPESEWVGHRFVIIAMSLVGLGSGWYVSQDRHWIMKIFLYVGMMILCIFIADFSFQIIVKLMT